MSVGGGRMIEALFHCEFVRDLVSNFYADVLAGLLLAPLAALLAYLVGKKLHFIELAQQQKKRDQNEFRRAIRYLRLLQVREVGPLLRYLPDWRRRRGEEFQIQTPLWFGVVRQGGELAGVVSPDLLSRLATFYQGFVYAKRGVNFLAESWLVEVQTSRDRIDELGLLQAEFNRMMDEGLEQADNAGEGLTGDIESEIIRLKGRLAETGLPASDIEKLENELEAIEPLSG